MLEKLRIRNFKGWKDTGDIRMAPITLFFGANSSGKSSIGQFLMMLKQTVESPNRKAVFYPGGRNSAVQLGSYQEMLFNRDPKNKIAFEYLWSLPEDMKIINSLNDQVVSGDSIEFNATVRLEDPAKHLLQVSEMKYRLLENNDQKISINLSRKDGKRKYTVSVEGYDLVKGLRQMSQSERKQKLQVLRLLQLGKMFDAQSPADPTRNFLEFSSLKEYENLLQSVAPLRLDDIHRFYGFPDNFVAYYQNADFAQQLNLAQEKLFNSLYYLGPLRTKAERLYLSSGIIPESVGFSGEDTVEAILASRDRKISLKDEMGSESLKPFEQVITLKLKEMDLIEEFHVNQTSENRQEYEVKVRTKGAKDFVDLPDVGFGVSQVLPVLVQCFYAPPGSIIIMEQPEIHLHPSAQSALADVMIDVINSRENGEERGIQLIIETHSEHFLRRLRRRIAEDKVSRDKVSTYFADITKTPTALDPLEIDEFGNIRNWPENFFGDEMGDITGQAKAAMKKRIQESDNPETL